MRYVHLPDHHGSGGFYLFLNQFVGIQYKIRGAGCTVVTTWGSFDTHLTAEQMLQRIAEAGHALYPDPSEEPV